MAFEANLTDLAIRANRIFLDGRPVKRTDVTDKLVIFDKLQIPRGTVTVDKFGGTTANDINGELHTLVFYTLKPILKKDIA